MKFEREKDIPAFRGKTAQECRALRREALRRDPAIKWVGALGGGLTGLWLPISCWLVSWIAPEFKFLLFLPVYFAISVPFYVAFSSMFITPRVRRALDSSGPNIA